MAKKKKKKGSWSMSCLYQIAPLPPHAPNKISIFSKVADLLVELEFGDECHYFLVSTALLRTVSPVWEKAFDPDSRFQPSPTRFIAGRQVRTSRLDDIEPAALYLFYEILHHNTRNLPERLKLDDMFQLSLLVDQFDCARVLDPWIEDWIFDAADSTYEKPSDLNQEKWLFVSNTFRSIKKAQEILFDISVSITLRAVRLSSTQPKLYLSSTPNTMAGNAKYEYPLFHSRNTDLIPEGILQYILSTREEIIALMVCLIEQFFREMINLAGLNPQKEKGEPLCTNEHCINVALGSLLRSLRQNQFDVPHNFGQLSYSNIVRESESIQTLRSRVERLKLATLSFDKSAHPDCSHAKAGSTDDIASHVILSGYQNLDMLQASDKEICPIALRLWKLQRDVRNAEKGLIGYKAPELPITLGIETIDLPEFYPLLGPQEIALPEDELHASVLAIPENMTQSEEYPPVDDSLEVGPEFSEAGPQD